MIKFRIFKNETDMRNCSVLYSGVVVYKVDRYSTTYLDILNNCSEPPFRDPESLRILQAYGIELLDDHWYSMMVLDSDPLDYPGKIKIKIRQPLSGVHKDIQYALTLLYYSRKGVYLSYQIIEKEIWQMLSETPFDILVAAWGNEIGRNFTYLPDEFLIVNYPYCGTEIEVHVKAKIDRRDSFFRSVELTKEDGADTSIGFHNPERGLYLGKDGLYYMDIHDMYVLEYYWPNDLKEVIRYMAEELLQYNKGNCIKLSQVGDTYSIEEFRRLLESADPDMNHAILDLRGDGKSCHKLALSENFKIMNHLAWMPYPDYYTRAMVVEKHADGTHTAFDHYVCKDIGGLEKLVMDALDMRKKDASLFCLYLNIMNPLAELTYMKYAICGIRVQWDSLEIFDKDDAWKLFAAELKEMVSGTTDSIFDDTDAIWALDTFAIWSGDFC